MDLQALGLSTAEEKVFLACLKLGTAKAKDIAAEAKRDRQSAYYTLKLLKEKGYVSEFIQSGIKHYSAIEPHIIQKKLTEDYREKRKAIQEVAKKLEKLKVIRLKRPKVEQYDGWEGFKSATRELLDKRDTIIRAYSGKKALKHSLVYTENYAAKRKELNTQLKVLTQKSKNTKESLREIKYNKIMKNKDYSLAIEGNKVIFVRANEKDQYGFKIEDKAFAELQKEIFELIWSNS